MEEKVVKSLEPLTLVDDELDFVVTSSPLGEVTEQSGASSPSL